MKKVSELPYERVKCEDVISVIKDCAQKAANAKSGKELAALRSECLKSIFHCHTMFSLSYTRFTLNTRDEFYSGEKDYYDEALPKISAEFVKFQKAFLNSPHLKEAEKFVHPLIIKQYALSVKCASDEAIPFKVEENKIVTEYTKLMAETLFEFDGEKMPLSALKKHMSAQKREVREKAYQALGKTLSSIGDKLDDIFDRLVKVRTKTAQVLGYENFVQLGDNLLGRISYNRDMIRAFRENVRRDVVPAVTKLKKELQKSLGIEKFMLYDNDTYFLDGNPTPSIDAQAMFEAGKEMYRDMGKDTGEFFDMMLETEAFDVFPREGKWGGGYMDSFIDFKQPFILANFNGTSGDVDVLTHEAGHAFAAYMSFKLNQDPDLGLGMETAETHSMSMEFLCYKYMNKFFGNRAQDYKYAHLFEAVNFIPYGTIVDYFQEIVYSKPEMTPAERNKLWNELEAEFRPFLTASGIPYLENGTRWQYQMHIYETPFYYIDYCLAQSVALQFYLKSREDYGKAFNSYLGFVRSGATEEFPRLITNAGLSSPFENGALKKLADNVEKALDELKKQ